jgi:hypothetical protein
MCQPYYHRKRSSISKRCDSSFTQRPFWKSKFFMLLTSLHCNAPIADRIPLGFYCGCDYYAWMRNIRATLFTRLDSSSSPSRALSRRHQNAQRDAILSQGVWKPHIKFIASYFSVRKLSSAVHSELHSWRRPCRFVAQFFVLPSVK